MSFHEVRFPANLSLGSVGGPERRTEVVTLSNGYEERNTPWSQSRHRYDAGAGMRSLDDVAELLAFFEARGGMLHGFRWKDWTDWKSCAPSGVPAFDDQRIGTGDGVEASFQLSKRYASGGDVYVRPIVKPVPGTVRAAVGGIERVAGAEFDIDPATGRLTFATPPGAGEPVTAGFEFDVPVRFDTDTIQVSVAGFQAGEVPSVPIVELRL
ncbi:MAG: phage distal tail protein, Rcc01695 family [Roseicyclus sp.]